MRAAPRRPYPDPIRSNTSRHETAASSTGDFFEGVARLRSIDAARRLPAGGRMPLLNLTARATCPVKGRRSATRAASPRPPRRGLKNAAPEVPSIDEPDAPRSPGRSRAFSEPGRGRSPVRRRHPELSTPCSQAVDKWSTPLCELASPSPFDETTVARPGGASSGVFAMGLRPTLSIPPSCRRAGRSPDHRQARAERLTDLCNRDDPRLDEIGRAHV